MKIIKRKIFGAGVLIFIGILSIVFIQSASAEEIEIDFSFDEPVITEVNISNTTYHKVTMNDTKTPFDENVPLLPVKSVRILLPQKGIIESINVTYEGNTSLGENYNVTLGNTSIIKSEQNQNVSNESNFNSSIPYPTEIFRSLGIYFFRGYSILLLELYPVHNIGDTGEIYYYTNMTVTITTNDSGLVSPFFRNLTSDEMMMKQIVDDHSMNHTYISMQVPANSTIVKSGDNYEFVIITREVFVDADPLGGARSTWKTFQDLADYKNDTNIMTCVVAVETILANPAYAWNGDWGDGDEFFDDTQCRIRNFIKHVNVAWGTQYVLLGGDNTTDDGVEFVPVRNLWYNFSTGGGGSPKKWYEGILPSDFYYACLEGNFNYDKDGFWGEPFDGGEAGDFVEPLDNPFYPLGDYYAEADSDQYDQNFEVGLFTPSFNLSEYSNIDIRIGLDYKFTLKPGESAEVRVYSGETKVKTFIINSGSGCFIKKFDIEDLPDKTEVYIEYYYNDGGEGKGHSFNIDEVIFETADGSTNFLLENFEDQWVENTQGDLVPDYDWKQEKYNQNEGVWTQEHYKRDVDLLADVYVGRAPVGNHREVSNFVSKTLNYQDDELIPDHDRYLEKVLLVGGKLTERGDNDDWGGDYCDEIFKKIDPNAFEFESRLYDRDIPGIHYWTRRQLRRRLNGYYLNNYFHIIYEDGHGYPPYLIRKIFPGESALLNHEDYQGGGFIPRLYNLDVFFSLVNKKPSFWYSNACEIGAFDNNYDNVIYHSPFFDCLGEYLTVKTKYGAFAAILNSRYGLFLLDDIGGATFELAEAFFDKLTHWENDDKKLGWVHQENKNAFAEEVSGETSNFFMRLAVYETNLLGDPTVIIRQRQESNNQPSTPNQATFELSSPYLYTFYTSTNDLDGDKVSYKWKVDDSECFFWSKFYGSGENANKIMMLLPGLHNVSVKARDIFLNESDWSDPLPLTVSFNTDIEISSTPVVIGENVQFNGQASAGTEPYNTWFYDLGDGNNSEQQNTTHAYNTLGTYNVTLTVTDDQNITSNVSKVVSVVLLKADFESSPSYGISNETIYLNDTSDGYHTLTNWSWDFGDANTSYNRNASHEYDTEGVYNVSLTVTDNQSNTDVYNQTIFIDSGTPEISSVSCSLDTVGYGSNVSFIANLTDNISGVKTVKINITYPDNSYGTFTMNNTIGSIYEYVLTDTSQLGNYCYNIWVDDNAENSDSSPEFNVAVSRHFGYIKTGGSNQSVWDTITGSVFKVREKCVADNITVYLDPGNATSDSHYGCMIYRHNGSELMGVTEEKNITSGKGWQKFNFSVPKPVLMNDTDYVLACWADNSSIRMYYDNGTGDEEYYDDGTSTLQGHYFEGLYNYTPDPINFDHEDRRYSIYCRYSLDNTSPEITNVSASPSTVGFGFNVTISADVTDNASGVNNVTVNVTYPNTATGNFTMNNTENNTYEYVFSDTWLVGQHNYTIWVVDYANNSNSSSGHSFNVSANATISVCTIKDSYGNNETINLTDPPGDPPEVGYELLDNGDVLHIWNKYDSYYFNTSSGIQLTNHKDDYWSHNILMLGYYNNDEWNLIYRTDELSGFNKDIDTDNETYVNTTIWKNLTYNEYDFRLAISYHLSVNDRELTVITYIKNIDQDDIPYTLGFGWEIKDIQIDMTYENDWIRLYNGTDWTSYLLNQTLDNQYTNMDYNTTFYLEGRNEGKYFRRTLYLKWDHTLDYLLRVKNRTGQYNAPVTLFIKVGTLDAGQEKYTEMYWLDSDDWLGISGSELNSHCGDTGEDNTLHNALYGEGYWDHAEDETHWFILDLGQNYTIKKLRGRSTTNQDPTSVDIYISTDNSTWGTAVASDISTWQDTTEWVEVDSTDKAGRYIKVEITATEDTISGYLKWGETEEPMTIFDAYGDTCSIATYYFNNYSGSEAWEHYPEKMTDGDTGTNAETESQEQVELLDGNSCSGTYLGTISKVEIRANGFYNSSVGANDIILRPVFKNKDGDEHVFDCGTTPAWSSWFDITNDTNAPNPWTWTHADNLDCDVEAGTEEEFLLYCSMVEIRVTYKPNNIPAISNPYPPNGSTGVSITPLLNITVSDPNSDTMNITWYSNSSGSWQVFGTNNSVVSNYTYHQTFSNATVNGQWWYWKVNVTDGTYYNESSVYKFYTGYQSKIKDTGSTSFRGYLLIQVQYYNTSNSTWIVANDTVNETSPRMVSFAEEQNGSGGPLALDTIFNGLVNTSNLSSFGNGTYRIYVAFRDPYGNILVTDDQTQLDATYEFTITFA